MNTLTQQLKQQAGIDLNPDQEGLDLFAQLIILECDRYARSTWEHGHLLGGDLKHLFGVEE
jgi:hypothetical protein